MENENNEIVEIPEIPQVGEGEEDTTDWKAEALKYQGIAQRFKTKVEKSKEEKPEAKPEEPKPQDKTELDLVEKTFLLASGIKKDQFKLVFDEAKSSGKSIEELLDSPYFKEKLEMDVSKNALPSDSKRSGVGSQNDEEYWIKKGEFPPNTPENQELRRKVANTLAKQAENKSKFSSNPIV
jgi:hypothetical protein